jgi:hypothetical protein
VVDLGSVSSPLPYFLCVNLCVKKFPKLTKTCKINKNVEIVYSIVTVCYCILRSLGNSKSLSTNP